MFIHKMNCYPALGAVAFKHGFMHPVTEHPLATETGQKSRVNIDNPSLVCFNYPGRNKPQKTRQNDQISVSSFAG